MICQVTCMSLKSQNHQERETNNRVNWTEAQLLQRTCTMTTSKPASRACPASTREIYLPTEIIAQIVYFIATSIKKRRRQRTLHACCLVSRQWYSVAVSFLYKEPRLGGDFAIKRFADTLCAPTGARTSKSNLGSFVRVWISRSWNTTAPSARRRNCWIE